METLIRIKSTLYKQTEPRDIKVGDLVFDIKDNTYGTIDMIYEGGTHVAIRDGWVVEVGVPVDRVRILTPFEESNNGNQH